MRTMFGILGAAAVIVVGAFFTATLIGGSDPAAAQAEPVPAEMETGAATALAEPSPARSLAGFADDFVDDVLAELVEKGTITEEQAAEISAAFAARLEAMVEDLPRLDGVLGPDGPLSEFLEDGELSDQERAELEELMGEFAPFGAWGFEYFDKGGPMRDRLREHFEDQKDLPLHEFLEDGELSEEERAKLEEMFGDRFPPGFWFFSEEGELPEDFGSWFGPKGFKFFLEEGEIPDELRETLEGFDFDDLPFHGFLDDGELSEEERSELREFFGRFGGRGFGGPFEDPDPESDADEAAFSA